MIDQDKTEFVKILGGMSELRGKPLSREAMSMYWFALSDWNIDEFRQAAKYLLTHCQFMPNPYDFEQLRQKASKDTAGEAWQQVRQAIRTRHHNDATTISPRVDQIVAIMGGWTALGMSSTDEMQWREKKFFELWGEQGSVEDARQALPLLAGDRPVDALLAGITQRLK